MRSVCPRIKLFNSTPNGMPPPDPLCDDDRADFSDRRKDEQRRKWRRTRSGCLNCRRKKRKCDERKPTCLGCRKKDETCEWGTRVTFRPENARTVLVEHSGVQTGGSRRLHYKLDLVNVTPEIIRECNENSLFNRTGSAGFADEFRVTPPSQAQSSLRGGGRGGGGIETVMRHTQNISEQDRDDSELQESLLVDFQGSVEGCFSGIGSHIRPSVQSYSMMTPSPTEGNIINNSRWETTVSRGEDTHFSALHCMKQAQPPQEPFMNDHLTSEAANVPVSRSLTGSWEQVFSAPDVYYEDGIFLPGSEYHELHSTLRKHLIQEVRSTAPTGNTSAGYSQTTKWPAQVAQPDVARDLQSRYHSDRFEVSDEPIAPNLSKEDEYNLWKNWLDEIAPWLDKFDNQRHFQHILPIMAQSHAHLRYAMLALSARQLERKDSSQPIERSLALYHQAIHLLLPRLHLRDTAVIASCVVLCALEMLSCSPKAWRRHLDGCASLMETVGINGFVGGVEQALFWCFARMDVCGGFISSTKTLIPANHWASGINLDADIGLFQSTRNFDTYANHALYLCAQVLDLLTSFPGASNITGFVKRTDDRLFVERWMKLWRYIDDWQARRPAELMPIVNIPLPSISPFPTILYSNSAAISGNQLYHTAAILMLQNKPTLSFHLDPKPRSILWHARQICGISMSNEHHGAWTNCIQPIWIAGRCMSHPNEHNAILSLLERIERESGWGTKWRAEDLKEFWGDLND